MLLFWLFFLEPPLQKEPPGYHYKAKNLKPKDYGLSERSWENVVSYQKNALREHPEQIEALYFKAIAYRERGLRRALLLRKVDWENSAEAFEMIIARDSSYRDVLFQYGLLYQYKRDFEEGIMLLHRQQEIKEARGYVEAALFRMYRHFIADKPAAEIEAWFEQKPSGYSRYFKAELQRQKGKENQANALFSELITSDFDLPVQPVLLSMARMHYARQKPTVAQAFVFRAIDEIEHEVDARMVYEDFKYIFTDSEVKAFKRINDVIGYKSFFQQFIAKRNPTKADEIDVRLEVHYNRLIEAEKIYSQYAPREAFRVIKQTERFQTADRDFPEAYWLNGELGDRGLIYVRHGAPDDKVASISENTQFIESWRYVNPDLIFHFEGHGGLGVLIPLLPLDLDVLEAREIWGGPYALLSQTLRRRQTQGQARDARTSELDIINYNNELFDQGLKDLDAGLSTDRFVWPRTIEHLDIAYMVSSFKGDENNTAVDVHFSLPLDEVARGLGREEGMVAIDVGLTVHDTVWSMIHEQLDIKQAPISTDANLSAIDVVQFQAAPDTYNVNVHVGINEVLRKGSYLFGYRVPEFNSAELAISDIIPAVQVVPTSRTGRYIKNGLQVQANPGRGFKRNDPLYLYFEIYNLRFSSNDLTHYTVEYTLETYSEHKRRRLFGKKKSLVLSVSFEREAQEGSPVEYGELDVSSVKKGTYFLRVTVTDKLANKSVSKFRVIELAN